jgi:hypothetical protein
LPEHPNGTGHQHRRRRGAGLGPSRVCCCQRPSTRARCRGAGRRVGVRMAALRTVASASNSNAGSAIKNRSQAAASAIPKAASSTIRWRAGRPSGSDQDRSRELMQPPRREGRPQSARPWWSVPSFRGPWACPALPAAPTSRRRARHAPLARRRGLRSTRHRLTSVVRLGRGSSTVKGTANPPMGSRASRSRASSADRCRLSGGGAEPQPGPTGQPGTRSSPRIGGSAWSRSGTRRAGTTVTPSTSSRPQGTWVPWTATMAATWTSATPRTSSACHFPVEANAGG